MRGKTRFLVMLLMALAGPASLAATGDVLIEYDSALGTLPARQGWSYQANCLRTYCPANAPPPPQPGAVNDCWFQGWNANDCSMEHGCGPDDGTSGFEEHFNAPPASLVGAIGACSYTEWLAFDDGEDYLDQPVPVGLPYRNLTFPPEPSPQSWGPHQHPAFGAVWFVNAPAHPPLRVVCGGGVPGISLPASAGNNRNLGRLKLSRQYPLPAGVHAVTLVAKLACGNRKPVHELIQLSGMGRRFSLGVDGEEGSGTLGTFTQGTDSSTETIFDGHKVAVALARQGQAGPHEGEFFTVRVVMRENGEVQAWLNENHAVSWSGTAGTGVGQSISINPDEQSSTMWVDYIQLLAGEVPPPGCGDPPFDVNRDGRINGLDRYNGSDGFLDCVTGPAAPAETLLAMPESCRCHDVNQDGAVDMTDFAAFQRCLTFGDAPLNPACDD